MCVCVFGGETKTNFSCYGGIRHIEHKISNKEEKYSRKCRKLQNSSGENQDSNVGYFGGKQTKTNGLSCVRIEPTELEILSKD